MATRIVVPGFGTSVEEVTLVRWLKQVGDPVARGDILCEVETDKAVAEIESFSEGVLLKQSAEEGNVLSLGDVVAYVGEEGEKFQEAEELSLQGREAAMEPAKDSPIADTSRESCKTMASPKARRLAKELGVKLTDVVANDANGAISEQDVRNAAKKLAPAGQEEMHDVLLSKNQLGVIRAITQSYRAVVPVDLVCNMNVTAAIKMRQQYDSAGSKLSYDAIFMKAVAAVLNDFPRFRSHLEGEKLKCRESINIGITISTEDELQIPVVCNADTKELADLDKEIKGLAAKAQNGTLTQRDVSGAVMTISNLGMYPISSFTAIIPPQQSAVLTMGTIQQTVRFVEDHTIATVPEIEVVLKVDHRVINGREAARFLQQVKTEIEMGMCSTTY